MPYLNILLSIVFSAFLVIYFKWLEKFNIRLLNVISINYLVCTIVGTLIADDFSFTSSINFERPSTYWAFVQGSFFITMFFLIGKSAQRIGVGYTAFLSKMSVVIPILFALIFLQEIPTIFKVIGIILAIVAVYFIQRGKISQGNDKKPFNFRAFALSITIFVGSGVIDSIFKYVEHQKYPSFDMHHFILLLFSVAAVYGLILMLWNSISSKKVITFREILLGIGLGLPNYFSIFFLFRAMQVFDAHVFFPVNNIGILLVSSLVGVFIYKEKYSLLNYIGMGMAIVAIFLLLN